MAQELKDLIPDLLKPKEQWKFQLLANWSSIIGNVGTKVCLEKIYDDTVVLGVYDACWMQELYMLSHLLIATINQNLDQPRIKQVRFKRAALTRAPALPSPPKALGSHEVIPHKPITAQQQAALDTIQDPQLQTALRNFLIRCSKETR